MLRIPAYARAMTERLATPDPTTLLRKFTNMDVYEGAKKIYLFRGKNNQGDESAELLNQLQLDGELFPLAPGVRPRGRGFHAIRLEDIYANNLGDLREVTTRQILHAGPCLVGPERRPLVFIILMKSSVKKSAEARPGWNGNTSFANDSGYIYGGPRRI